jgi:hypothetical protein
MDERLIIAKIAILYTTVGSEGEVLASCGEGCPVHLDEIASAKMEKRSV